MTDSYWDKSHTEIYSKSDWGIKPTIFSELAHNYFPKKGSLLDIGTGQGQDAAYFSSLGYDVTATDFSDEAISNAKRNIPAAKILKVDTEKGLPFDDNSFDVVYSHLALHYFTDEVTKKVFIDIHRILKPGGIFATITNTIEDPEILDSRYKKIETGFYNAPGGISKRYFSVDYMRTVTKDLYQPLLIDGNGETYKDEIKTLVRFIGRAVK
jgi:SAM-dependent methyltransferase